MRDVHMHMAVALAHTLCPHTNKPRKRRLTGGKGREDIEKITPPFKNQTGVVL